MPESKVFISWRQYFEDLETLYQKVLASSSKFDTIVGINRGGNILATLLSHRLNVPCKIVSKEQSIDWRGRLLICDDVSDTGSTFLTVLSHLKTYEYATAALHYKAQTKHIPTFCARLTSGWLVYPYEDEPDRPLVFSVDISC